MCDVDSIPVDPRPASDPLSTPDETVADCAAFVETFVDAADAERLVIVLDASPGAALLATVAVRGLGADRVQALSVATNARAGEADDAAATLAADLGVSLREVDLQPLVRAFLDGVASTVRERRRSPFDSPGTVRVDTHPNRERVPDALRAVEARLRMVAAYFEANTTGAVVASPVDRTERLLGAGPAGDLAGADLLPLVHLYRTEVLALGLHVGVPRPILVDGAAESDGRLPAFLSDVPDVAVDDALRSLVDEGRSVADVAADGSLDEPMVRRLADALVESAHERGRPPTPDQP